MKFAEGMVVRQSNGDLVSLGPEDVSAVRQEFGRQPVIDVRPLFSRDVPELEAERERARQGTGTSPPDLTLFFVVTLAPDTPEEPFVERLVRLPGIESAYVLPEPAPPPAPPPAASTEDREPRPTERETSSPVGTVTADASQNTAEEPDTMSEAAAQEPGGAPDPAPGSFVIWERPPGPVRASDHLVIVNFAEGMVVRLSNGDLVSLGGQDVAAVQEAFARHPVLDVRPLFGRDVPELEAERERARQQSGISPPDLTLFFVVTLAPDTPEQPFIDSLLPLHAIDSAYVLPEPAPPPAPPGG